METGLISSERVCSVTETSSAMKSMSSRRLNAVHVFPSASQSDIVVGGENSFPNSVPTRAEFDENPINLLFFRIETFLSSAPLSGRATKSGKFGSFRRFGEQNLLQLDFDCIQGAFRSDCKRFSSSRSTTLNKEEILVPGSHLAAASRNVIWLL